MSDPLRHRDIQHLWHPCTDINDLDAEAIPIIERAQGVYLYEVGGRPLLDGIASWWCVNLGHSHPRLVEAIRRQVGTLQHAILGGMAHPNAIELAHRLAQITPGDLQHCFFCCDGASAVEAALKIAVQYWVNIGQSGRSQFVGLEEGYHGDTLGAMGIGYVEAFHAAFRDVLTPAHRACSPHCLQCPFGKQPDTCDVECFASMRAAVEQHHARIAAVVVEPLCQGAAGVRIYPERYLQQLRALCDEYGLLLIADEIAVGFGRTGSLFACERTGIVPDIMVVGKGLTGGYMPMSAVVATDAIYQSFRSDAEHDRTFWHSHTFGGNPITSALAMEALSVYQDEQIIGRSQPQIRQLADGMTKLSTMLDTFGWRAMGMMGVIEITEAAGGADRAKRITRRALELGLFIRPRSRAIYLWPPLTTTADQLNQMLTILADAIEQTG